MNAVDEDGTIILFLGRFQDSIIPFKNIVSLQLICNVEENERKCLVG